MASNVLPFTAGAPRLTASVTTASPIVDLARTLTVDDVDIAALGRCLLPSPVAAHLGEKAMHFVGKADRVLVNDQVSDLATGKPLEEIPAFELAGPRNKIYFDPRTVRCGIVTCGGLCPGLNNVVRGLVLELFHGYGVKRVYGFRYGYEGIISRFGHEPLTLSPESVANIHHQGGTVLGSSRGEQNAVEVVDALETLGVSILFVGGGDGTMRGAQHIAREIELRNLKIGVLGVPKTIDNDLHFIDRSFGFESAYASAVDAIRSAKVEAMGAARGIGLVKLMGRHSGFVACHAALACTDVDLVLIPEVPVALAGQHGVYAQLDKVLSKQGHAVVVVAEGAAQELIATESLPGSDEADSDKSGNVRLKDVGVFLRDKITAHFQSKGSEVTLKYIDPSYTIRSVAASPSDSVYCWHMARNAVHAAMAGNTEMLIGRWHGRFVHVPMALATRARKQVDPAGDLWMSVIEATGQPLSWTG
ncbi:MAG TPA: ATP-dependent 6-phosphofructokinase [Polyangiaceae bacterium]|nr:ATP-dependent 6-phosphofructokinase [Polyangiaceae bacterium]